MLHSMIGVIGRVKVHRNRVSFSKIEVRTPNVSNLGSLVFDKRKTLGPKAFLDFSNYPFFQLLIRDFIASLDEHSVPGVIAHGSAIGHYGYAIREFLAFCKLSEQKDDLRMSEITQDLLIEFRSHIRISRPNWKSGSQRRLFGNLLRLLKAGREVELANSDFAIPRNIRAMKDSDVTQPYTAGEALDIENACRAHMRTLMKRLNNGRIMLGQGSDPRGKAAQDPTTGRILSVPPEKKAWNQLPNLLWFAVNVMGGIFVKYSGAKGSGISSFNNATNGAFKGPYRKKDVFSHLYPFAEDLIPFIVLLAKITGRNETSLLSLSRNCLQQIDNRYVLWYRKERGAQRLYRKILSSEGQFSAVTLIHTLIQITEPLVKLANPEHRDLLFLGFTLHVRNADNVKPLDPSYIKAQMNRENGWCEQFQLLGNNGLPLKISLRRLRVFYLTSRYKNSGQLSKVSRDAAHTLSRTSVGYVLNESTKHIHERATEDGIKAALRAARPTVIIENKKRKASLQLKTTEAVAESILRGEQDVFFASCRDFYNRPGGPADTACSKPWECFECSNAIITRHVLPKVIAFRDFVEQQKTELSQEDWIKKFGSVWSVITQSILPQFSTSAISEAEQFAAQGKLYIPLALKT